MGPSQGREGFAGFPVEQISVEPCRGWLDSAGARPLNMAAGNLGLMSHTCAEALVCDSAAAATAMFTGYKTNIGMIGMTPNKQPVRNLAEAATSCARSPAGRCSASSTWAGSASNWTVTPRSPPTRRWWPRAFGS